MRKLTGQDYLSLYDVSVASFKTCIALGVSAKVLEAGKVKRIKERWTEFLISLTK